MPDPSQQQWTGQPGQPQWSGGQPSWHMPPMSQLPPAHPMPPAPGYWQPAVAVKPGVIPLRPLGLGEILDGAISTMRAHPRLMLGVAAVVVTITQLLVLAATFPLLDDIAKAATFNQFTPPSEIWDVFGKSMAVAAIGLLLPIATRVFLSGFITLVVGTAVLGQPLKFKDVWTRVRSRLLPLLGLTMVYPAVVIGAVLVVIMITLLSPVLGVLVIIGVIVVGIWLMVMFSLATPALVLENASVGQAFGRSRHLVRGSWWRIFGITLLAGVIATIISVIIGIPFEYLGDGFATVTANEPIPTLTTKYLLLTTLGAVIAATITEPFVVGVAVLLYTDQRMRREGLDIELARAAGAGPYR